MPTPTLWHLKVSPYNEKARWAFDFKRVPHVRRAVMPVRHEKIARRVWGGDTLPAMVVDGKAIGDSTRIVEWLEWSHPEPALYPSDTAGLARAFELEDFFDEELGPYVRRLVLHHAMGHADLLLGAFVPDLRGARRRAARATFPLTRRRLRREFGIDDRGVAQAFDRIAAAGERLRAELQPSGYLVGDSFTVADLTLASMCAPAAAPRRFQYPQPQRDHPLFEPLRDALDRAGLLDFTLRMYELHRGESAEM
jgi:glutathione S-transferase